MDYIIDFVLLALIYFLFFYNKWVKKPKKILVINTIMYVYIVMVLFFTLMPFTIPLGGTNNFFMQTANFIPFKDLMLSYDGAIKGIFLNVIMMMPFGFLYPIIRGKGILGTIILTFFFSLIIESTQLLSVWWGSVNSRTFDITDLITNTFGGLIGYFIYIVLRPVIRKIPSENKRRY